MTPPGISALIAALSPNQPKLPHKNVVASWSGGIDSTAVIAHLLARGYRVHAVTLSIYGNSFGAREETARLTLLPFLQSIAKAAGGELIHINESAEWIWAFSPNGIEIPRRNKHIIDRLITHHAMPLGIKNIALGEYSGADTWLVADHVAGADADHRSLASYVFNEYGLSYRLISLQDFGESRYKTDRVRLLSDVLGAASYFTSVCLVDSPKHCGKCYKCVERHAAFMLQLDCDLTQYESDPAQHKDFNLYKQQMRGFAFSASHADFPTEFPMPKAAKEKE